eukprot:1114059-Pelagomonas_calceolata.AAC.1
MSYSVRRDWVCICADDEGLVLLDADDEDTVVAVPWTEADIDDLEHVAEMYTDAAIMDDEEDELDILNEGEEAAVRKVCILGISLRPVHLKAPSKLPSRLPQHRLALLCPILHAKEKPKPKGLLTPLPAWSCCPTQPGLFLPSDWWPIISSCINLHDLLHSPSSNVQMQESPVYPAYDAKTGMEKKKEKKNYVGRGNSPYINQGKMGTESKNIMFVWLSKVCRSCNERSWPNREACHKEQTSLSEIMTLAGALAGAEVAMHEPEAICKQQAKEKERAVYPLTINGEYPVTFQLALGVADALMIDNFIPLYYLNLLASLQGSHERALKPKLDTASLGGRLEGERKKERKIHACRSAACRKSFPMTPTDRGHVFSTPATKIRSGADIAM